MSGTNRRRARRWTGRANEPQLRSMRRRKRDVDDRDLRRVEDLDNPWRDEPLEGGGAGA